MSVARLTKALKQLAGETVWEIGVHPASGATFSLAAGEQWRMPWNRPGMGYRKVGQFDLYVPCSWRLEDSGAIMLSSAELMDTDTGWAEDLRVLEGLKVGSVVVRDSARSVNIKFGGDRTLFIFADHTAREEHNANYGFSPSLTEKFWLVGGGAVEMKPRFSPEELETLERVT